MKEKAYTLTFKGLLSTVMPEDKVDDVMEKIRAYLYMTKTNAVVFEDSLGGEFVTVGRKEK